MKKTLFISLFSFFFFYGHSTHIAGGEITYKYIGDSTNIPHQYELTLRLFRDMRGIPAQADELLVYSSSCAGGSIALHRVTPPPYMAAGDGGFIIPAYGVCSVGDSLIGDYSIHLYRDTITLPMACSDWLFYWKDCCRNNAISTLQNSTSSNSDFGYYVYAKLNNAKGENHTPTGSFADDVRVYCAGSNVTMFPFTEELDGDSLHFEFSVPLEDFPPGTQIPYTAGFSSLTPLSSSTPFFIDPTDGVITFSPTQAEVGVIAVRVEEWRLDTVSGLYYQIGELQKDLQVVITNNCDSLATFWSLETGDSIPKVTIKSCGDSVIPLHSPIPFQCNSLSADGSDFIVYKPDGTLLPIIAANSLCDKGYADSLTLTLYDTLANNDTLYLVSHIGNDFNTLTNLCGFNLRENDSIMVIVEGCPNIGFTAHSELVNSVYPNPFNDQIQIETVDGSSKTISLFSSSGELIYQEAHSGKKITIYMGSFPSGMYHLVISNKQTFSTFKLIKP